MCNHLGSSWSMLRLTLMRTRATMNNLARRAVVENNRMSSSNNTNCNTGKNFGQDRILRQHIVPAVARIGLAGCEVTKQQDKSTGAFIFIIPDRSPGETARYEQRHRYVSVSEQRVEVPDTCCLRRSRTKRFGSASRIARATRIFTLQSFFFETKRGGKYGRRAS